MLSVQQQGFGGVQALVVTDKAEPTLDRPDAVRVRLTVAGAGRWDRYRCLGLFGGGHAPFVAGYAGCGVVEAAGPLVRRLRPGDRVWWTAPDALGPNGAWAEVRVAPEEQLLPVPDEIGSVIAGSAPLALCSAMLTMDAVLQGRRPGRVLIHDAGSDTGFLLTQLALAETLRIAALVRDEAQAARLRGLGVDAVAIDDSLDGEALIGDWSEGAGSDVLACCDDTTRAVSWFDSLAGGGRVLFCSPTEPVGAWRMLSERGLRAQFINPLLATPAAAKRRRQCLEEGGDLLARSRLELPEVRSLALAEAAAELQAADDESEVGTLALINA